MGKGFFRKEVIDRYFLERKCPYTKRSPFKMKALYWAGGILLALFVVGVLFYGGEPERKGQNGAIPDYNSHNTPVSSASDTGALNSTFGANAGKSGHRGEPRSLFGGIGYGIGGVGDSTGRTRNANQVIRRGEGGNDPGSRLPMGFGVPAKLLNAILSTDSASPVIAEVTDDVFTHGTLSIPAGSHAIGNAAYDNSSHRIQVRFHTFVYPDGDQHAVQGIGMMGDGSAGLEGDYHSGEGTRQVGRFLGNFIGGLADGMKDTTASGQYGIPYSPGSLKNGLLNGVSLSAQDEAKSLSDGMSQAKPTMTLPSGQSFVLYLEHDYVP